MKRFNVSLFNRLVAYIKTKNFVTDEEAKKAAKYAMNTNFEDSLNNVMSRDTYGVVDLFCFDMTEERQHYWWSVHQRTHTPYNTYSGWIFEYLENNIELGRMCSDFSGRFFYGRSAFYEEPHMNYLTEEEKLCIFWLLAHVDQATADAMLEKLK